MVCPVTQRVPSRRLIPPLFPLFAPQQCCGYSPLLKQPYTIEAALSALQMLNTGCTAISLLDYVTHATNDYIAAMPKTARKQYGQFFTSQQTAEFMAGLFDLSAACGAVSVLDPGAGSGILSAAMIERLQAQPNITKDCRPSQTLQRSR